MPFASEGIAINDGVFDLQTLDENGGMASAYIYLTTDDGKEKDGWYTFGEKEEYATKTFEEGEAFMLNNTVAGGEAGVIFSGEAILSDVIVDLPQFYSIKGNLCSTPISIQDLIPITRNEESAGDGVFDLQTLDENGGMASAYIYLTTDDGKEKDGWYTFDEKEEYATKTFEPSDGFMINNSVGAKAQLKYKISK